MFLLDGHSPSDARNPGLWFTNASFKLLAVAKHTHQGFLGRIFCVVIIAQYRKCNAKTICAYSRTAASNAMVEGLGLMTGYLLLLATMLSIPEWQGVSWTLATAWSGMAVGIAVLFLAKRAETQGFTQTRLDLHTTLRQQ
jgi:hypothetical protein